MATESDTWFPLFEFQDWIYQSFLLLPTDAENEAPAGSPVTARKWVRGELVCGQAFGRSDKYVLSGTLSFEGGLELAVSARGRLGSGVSPASFEATGTGVSGPTLGAVSQLVGWVFPELPLHDGGGKVLCVRGSIRAVRGTDIRAELDLSGMPLGTVGAFVIARAPRASAF
jgi:hypothetical protein